MKRSALVEYSSFDEEAPDPVAAQYSAVESLGPQPPPKKRKLPSLSEHLLPQIPVDDPALHQGRRRTTPHVEGQFAAYVYVPVVISKKSRLFKLLSRIFLTAREDVPILQPVGFTVTDAGTPREDSEVDEPGYVELHVSLTRPTYLRAHQREEFKRAVKAAAKSRVQFSASFATVADLTNDEHTRTFLTLEVGAGHGNFKELSDSLAPTLRSIRQKDFYEQPRFHVSIAWALLDGSRDPPSPASGSQSLAPSADQTLKPPLDPRFPTIRSFPSSLVPRLNTEYGHELVSPLVGTFEVEELCVRIGKDIGKWRLPVN